MDEKEKGEIERRIREAVRKMMQECLEIDQVAQDCLDRGYMLSIGVGITVSYDRHVKIDPAAPEPTLQQARDTDRVSVAGQASNRTRIH